MANDYTQLQNSGFLDYNSYRSTASLPSGGTPLGSFTINVGLVFDRANDPTALLNASWASRQQQIANLTNSNTLWATYGADSAKYQLALSDLAALNIPTVSQVDPNNGYVSSAADRTIWVQLDATTFQTLFNTTVLKANDQSGNPFFFWNGNLSLPTSLTSLGVKGLEFDSGLFVVTDAGADAGADGGLLPNPGGGVAVTLPQGQQSPGNDVPSTPRIDPQIIAFSNYHYPLTNVSDGTTIPTGTIGLVEPGIGAALPKDSASFSTLLTQYLQSVYNNASITAAPVTDVAPGGQSSDGGSERSLDVGIVAAIDPQSPLVLYAGSGDHAHANSDTYTAYQSAIWDTINNPPVISTSYSNFAVQQGAGSPFVFAAKQLFVDAALRNITMLTSNSDGGSGDEFGDGVTNDKTGQTSPYGIMVGGTSISTPQNAESDPTLNPPDQGAQSVAIPIVPNAQNAVLSTLWQLVRGGMVAMPYPSGQTPSSTTTLIETVWNEYNLSGSAFSPGYDYFSNNASLGGVDPTQAEPNYQLAFGLTPATSDPAALVGRGVPDVAALAGGDMAWHVPGADMTGFAEGGGTSASTPAWAALISQINAVFQDQGLPQLGYMNDLLYLADAIYPASFNDITVGSNTSSYTLGGTTGTVDDSGVKITPTGFGYSAGPGYDMTTGLGSPDGLLLARTLSGIAHSQMFFASVPNALDAGGPTGWQSGAAESLLFQTSSSAAATVSLQIGGTTTSFTSAAAGAYAWTSQFAEQTLQPDFDPNLVVLFDKQSQGTVVQGSVASNTALGVAINSAATTAPQGTLTNSFGFVTFADGNGNTVQVARPVAIAETAGGQSDQLAVVRIRDGSTDSDTLGFYRVDDLNGTINGLQPGDPGYAAAAQARAYQMTSGGTSINTLSDGQYQQTALEGVNAGDLIAFELTDNTTGNTYWGFSQGNQVVNGQNVAHLWNYGANTWGWQDGSGGNDFNDPVFQLDFTSASGQGLLVGSYGLPKSTSQGNDDLLLQTSQQTASWTISGTSVVGGGNINQLLQPGWSILGSGAFEGGSSSDILLQSGQQLAEWQMNGQTVVGGGNLSASLQTGWSVAAIGDLDGNTHDDLVLQNGQQLAEWQMNGQAVVGGGDIGTLGAGWSIAGIGDFNNDGSDDLLLQDGQQLAEWQMNGPSVIGGGPIDQTLAAGWSAAGVGDFNNDGNADILLQNGQQLALWEMNGTSVIGGGTIGTLAAGWLVAGVGNFNNDGNADILLQNGQQLAEWQMQGASVIGGGNITPALGPGWSFLTGANFG